MKFNEILDTGKYGDADAPWNGLFITGHGLVSTGANRPRIVESLKKIPFIVGSDIWLTETMKYCDIVLPNCSWFEHTEILGAWQGHPYMLYQSRTETYNGYPSALMQLSIFPILPSFGYTIYW